MQNIAHRISKILAFRLGKLGERFNIHLLIYNPWMMLEFNEHGNREAPKVYDAIIECFPNIKSVLDIGSGSGSYAEEGLKRGISVLAVEHSWIGRKLARKKGVTCVPFDLLRDPPAQISGEFDLI